MIDNEVLISVVMPTLNAQEKIEVAIQSIKKQTINQKQIEILVVDGGSKDKTREIALRYGAKVINNPKVLPEAAKHIGLKESKGKYIVFMDSDEELISEEQFENRLKLFDQNPQIKCILPNSLNTPKGYSKLSRYVNSFGDPFTYFVYKFDSENLINSLDKKKYKYADSDAGRVYYFKDDDIVPIGDGGTVMFDLEYLRKNFSSEIDSLEFIAARSSKVIKKTGCMGIINDDGILHYSSSYFTQHLRKLKFRVISNLAPKENYAGFASRSNIEVGLNKRKYLFIVYCILIPWVLVDSIVLSIKKKSMVFMLHFVFTYYVFFEIIIQVFLSLIGKKNIIKTYGE